MSENAFRTVLEIDTVRAPFIYFTLLTIISQMGTFNTVKATLPHIRASHGSYIQVSATLHHNGNSQGFRLERNNLRYT